MDGEKCSQVRCEYWFQEGYLLDIRDWIRKVSMLIVVCMKGRGKRHGNVCNSRQAFSLLVVAHSSRQYLSSRYKIFNLNLFQTRLFSDDVFFVPVFGVDAAAVAMPSLIWRRPALSCM